MVDLVLNPQLLIELNLELPFWKLTSLKHITLRKVLQQAVCSEDKWECFSFSKISRAPGFSAMSKYGVQKRHFVSALKTLVALHPLFVQHLNGWWAVTRAGKEELKQCASKAPKQNPPLMKAPSMDTDNDKSGTLPMRIDSSPAPPFNAPQSPPLSTPPPSPLTTEDNSSDEEREVEQQCDAYEEPITALTPQYLNVIKDNHSAVETPNKEEESVVDGGTISTLGDAEVPSPQDNRCAVETLTKEKESVVDSGSISTLGDAEVLSPQETQPVVEAGAPGKNQWVDMQEVNTLKEAIESCKNDFTELRCVGSQVDGNGVVKYAFRAPSFHQIVCTDLQIIAILPKAHVQVLIEAAISYTTLRKIESWCRNASTATTVGSALRLQQKVQLKKINLPKVIHPAEDFRSTPTKKRKSTVTSVLHTQTYTGGSVPRAQMDVTSNVTILGKEMNFSTSSANEITPVHTGMLLEQTEDHPPDSDGEVANERNSTHLVGNLAESRILPPTSTIVGTGPKVVEMNFTDEEAINCLPGVEEPETCRTS